MASSSKLETIYVLLIDEPVPVWRPVSAVKIDNHVYQIAPQPVPVDEEWEFQPGSRVTVEDRTSDDGSYLAAVAELGSGIARDTGV
ncbi:MAG: hypothetical protein ACK5JR_01660 [Tropicimonas sp.]|uniref:hypothetical protein n=1 Tax=Tropicimonas sp. TaxID=2067044 RepID=UPI003A877B5F